MIIWYQVWLGQTNVFKANLEYKIVFLKAFSDQVNDTTSRFFLRNLMLILV